MGLVNFGKIRFTSVFWVISDGKGGRIAATCVVAREIGRLLQQSSRQARDLARGFNPVHLEAIGLMAALEDF